MDFLKNMALPQSAEHIELLHYLLVLILFIFIPFISMIFGGTGLSLYLKRKEKKDLDENSRKLAKDLIEIVTINKNVGLILGLVPLFTIIIIFSQLFQTGDSTNLIYLGVSFLLLTIAMNYIYDYKNSFRYIGSVDLNSGKIGFIFVFFSLWCFVAGITIAVNYSDWQSAGFFGDLFSGVVIFRFISFIIVSFAVTGGGLLFGFFYMDRDKRDYDEEYENFVRKIGVRITFSSAVFIPFLIFINLLIFPNDSLSTSVFVYVILGLFFIFLGFHFLYMLISKASSKFTALLFFTILFTILTVIISDQLVISNSTKVNSAGLAFRYEEILSELKGETGPVELNGEEIYNIKCGSCHKFDRKLVGPPHNDVVPKYFGKETQLVAFIRNPGRVDPDFPAMPNPGLKPAEAKAVADYVLQIVKENLGQ